MDIEQSGGELDILFGKSSADEEGEVREELIVRDGVADLDAAALRIALSLVGGEGEGDRDLDPSVGICKLGIAGGGGSIEFGGLSL